MSNASEKIRVVLLTDCLAGLTGGAERQIYELAREIDKSRFDITVVSLECGESTPPEIIDHIGCEVKLFPIRRIYSFNGIRQGREFSRWLKESGAEVLMTYHFSSDMWGAYFARAAGVKHIISNRRDMGFWRRFHHDAAYKIANRWVERVVTNSRAIKNKVEEAERFPPERVQVIYNGINGLSGSSSTERNAVRDSIGCGPADVVLMHIANLKPVKGHIYLLKAFAELDRRFPLKLVLIGSDEYNGHLQRLAQELDIGDDVVFLGERQDARRLLEAADICLLPSISEGLSNAILEYMAAAKPVIATDVGGNAELIDDGVEGFLVPKESARDLKEALLRLIDSESLRERMGQKGREKVERSFTVKHMTQGYENLFEGVVGRSDERVASYQ